jgi:hypothetical protein
MYYCQQQLTKLRNGHETVLGMHQSQSRTGDWVPVALGDPVNWKWCIPKLYLGSFRSIV